ncbi:MAG: choice-of-anchor B family protein [Bacteroidota bacterium]
MRNLPLLCLWLLALPLGAQSFNMNLLGTWHDPSLHFSFNRYSDVWGYAADGREYALLGSQAFVHILDVTDPANITELHRLNAYVDSRTVWRDIKIYDHYAYCVSDIRTTEGLQVINLANLPTSASIVYRDTFDFKMCHNAFIDSTASPARLYLFGTSGGEFANDLMVYSLADPANPALLASIRLPEANYIHDGYARNDTLYANQGNPGMFAYDLRDLNNIVLLSSLSGYDEAGYNHSAWATESGDYLVMCDETVGTGVKMVSLDKSDPFFLNMEVEAVFRSTLSNPASDASLAHNPYVLGDSLVVLSYYGDGIQVWDIRDPTNPFRLGYYDTTTGTNYGAGIWGAYPWLPSGNWLASDMTNGLYVVEVDNVEIALPVTYGRWTALAAGKDVRLEWATTNETNNLGWTVEHASDGGDFTPLGFVSNGTGEYSFVHQTPGAGTHYYRLRQRDFDGTERTSPVRSVDFGGAETLRLYPNPAPAAAPVLLRGLSANAVWTITDMTGRALLRGTGNRITANLAPGVYVVRSGEQSTRLFVR